ncbi:hypothetical protein U1Q18_047595 [Sarracenia purpurea var. burkii]
MSRHSSCGSNNSFDIEELLQIGTRCQELRKEKEMLRDSQSQSFDLIRTLALHVQTLSKSHEEDEKHIQELERELKNCSQEIDYLEDQLNARNEEVYYLSEHVHSLELKLTDMENLEEKFGGLREALSASNSERLNLIKELESKELKLQNSTSCIEKLDDSVSSVALEYQCEMESMKLDLMALEQSCFEAKKFHEEATQERAKMDELLQDFELHIRNEEKIIESLSKENKELRKKLKTSEMNARVFCQKIEEQFEEWLENKDGYQLNTESLPCELKKDSSLVVGYTDSDYAGNLDKRHSTTGYAFMTTGGPHLWRHSGPLLSRLAIIGATCADFKDKIDNMSLKIDGYEHLVKQLKEELRAEKLKAREEAEDLAQEMAELRYQIMGLLEEERKRRACIEQISLQRIAELEAQSSSVDYGPVFVDYEMWKIASTTKEDISHKNKLNTKAPLL